MIFEGFCGGTYQSESVNVDCQRAMNFYPETNAPASASQVSLYQRAGKLQFADLGTGPVAGLFSYQPAGSPSTRVFAVAGNFTEIFSDGSHQDYTFVSTGFPVTMAANNANQIIICTGGNLWCFNTTTNTAAQVATGLGKQFVQVAFLNGFFLALQANSQTVWFSAVEDGTSWDALDFFAVNLFPDNVLSMIVDHGLIWLHGPKQSAVYYNTTDQFNPFLPATTQPIEQGTGAPFSEVKLDNSIYWIGADERGQGVAWRANGYVPQRITTYAVETAWQSYSMISDAVGYPYQENGHPFWIIYFPTANKTWAYDASTGFWHERCYLTPATGLEVADRGRCHVFAFGKHLVGDTQSGKIWDASVNYVTDNGDPISRYRRAPHLNRERKRNFYNMMQIDLESGLGPSISDTGSLSGSTEIILQDSGGQLWSIQMNGSFILTSTAVASGTAQTVVILDSVTKAPWLLGVSTSGMLTTTPSVLSGVYIFPIITSAVTQGQIMVSNGILQSGAGTVAYRGPYVYLRWSDDGAHTWKNQQLRDAGQLGEYAKRVMWWRLGKSRDRVYEFGTSEAFSCRVVGAYMQLQAGN